MSRRPFSSLFSPLTARKERLLVGIMALLVIALVTRAYWLFPPDTLPSASRDLKSNLLPILMYKVQVAAGEFPLHSPWYSSESNLANPLWNFFYLPATLLYLSLPVILATRLVILLHIVGGWLAMHLLLRAYTERRIAAAFGAFLYVFSGIWTAALTSYHIEKVFGLALLPLVFLGFKRLLDAPTWRGAVFLALALAGLVYAGSMYLLVFTIAALLVLILLLLGQRQTQTRRWSLHLLLALALFLAISAPKLRANLQSGIASSRPDIFIATPLDLATTFFFPGDLWPLVLPAAGLWRWNETTAYISVAGLALAIIGLISLRRGPHRRWLLPWLVVIALLFYWSLGFPPFGLGYPLSQLRVASRALILNGFLACLLAGIGLDALLAGRVRLPQEAWVLIIAGFLLEQWYVLMRGFPTLAHTLFGAGDAAVLAKLLWLYRWQPLLGWGIAAAVLVILGVWAYRQNTALNRPALALAALALFAVVVAMTSNPLESETNPLDDPALRQLRQVVRGHVVALDGNIQERDVRGRVELALAGQAHLLNPYYGSFGQDVSPAWLNRVDFVISALRIEEWHATILRHWSPFGELATIPGCQLRLEGIYETQDPLTRNDLDDIATPADIASLRQATQTLYLYRVDRAACSENQNPG